MKRDSLLWTVAVAAVLFTLAGCGGGGNPASPGPVEPTPAPRLVAPDRLRAVWSGPDDALVRVSQRQANAVVLLIDTWSSDQTQLAAALRERGVVALPYVEQCFTQPRTSWAQCWSQVERWSAPLDAAGVLVGYHVMDEPAMKGLVGIRDDANAYVRAKGWDVLGTEWIEYVTDQRKDPQPRPAVRWYAVTCYDFGSPRTKWHFQNCAEEYTRHRDWDHVVGQGFDAGNGVPNPAKWEELAARLGRGIIWWQGE